MESTGEQRTDALGSFRGYEKMSESEEREYRRRSRKRLIIISFSVALLAIIVVGVAAGVVVQRRHDGDDDDSGATQSTSAASSIKAVCDSTRYPDSCYSSLQSAAAQQGSGSGSIDDNPEALFKMSLKVAADALSNVTSLPDELAQLTNDKTILGALGDCREMLHDAVDRLDEAIELLRPAAPGEKELTASKISTLKSWLSATVTDQATCLDGLADTTREIQDRMLAALVNSTQFTSNSLAIVTKIVSILQDLGIPLHRKLLATAAARNGAVPTWMSARQRRVLREKSSSRPKPNVTVAKDGSGDVRTINEALAMIPKKENSTFVIYVKEGLYEELVKVEKWQWNVLMYGDGMYKTVVTGSLNYVDGVKTFRTATFTVTGRGFIARDMGFQNTAGPNKHQAVAVRAASDFSLFYRCSFVAFQDTLYAYSLRQFYRECDIVGSVDFIFGDASAVLQNCTIRPRQPLPDQKNIVTAQGRTDPNENTGFSIHSCSIVPYDNVTVPTFLGRPWKAFSTAVYIRSNIGSIVNPVGWLEWDTGVEPPGTIYYAEYMNTGDGSGTKDRVTWKGYHSSVSRSDVRQYGVDSFIQGSEWLPATGVNFASSV